MRHEDLHEDDWKEEAPLLSSLPKHREVDVPEGYFEGLPTSVLGRIKALSPSMDEAEERRQPSQDPVQVPLMMAFRQRVFWSVAASVLLLMGIGVFFLTRENDSPAGSEFADAAIQIETKIQLASLEATTVASQLDVSHVTDEQLFAALGSEGGAAFDDTDHQLHQDEAIEYLKGVDLDDIDLQDLDIDVQDL